MHATRDLLRRRTGIVRHGADLKSHVANTTSQYNLPPNKVNLKNISAREQIKTPLPTPIVQRNVDLDMAFARLLRQKSYPRSKGLLNSRRSQHQPVYFAAPQNRTRDWQDSRADAALRNRRYRPF